MPDFRVALTPGILTDIENPIQIRFTSPRRAQAVIIRIIEMESWDNLGDTLSEAGVVGSDALAEFTGAIDNFRFTPEESRTEQATDETITLKIQFHGQDQLLDVPMLDAGFNVEGGEIEIGLEVSGEIGGQQKEYVTPSPVFVRHPQLSAEANRPLMTFITANDAFHRAGRAYWRPRSDGLRNTNNLQQILAYVSDPEHLSDDRKWGQINIVSHGNEFEWFVRSHTSSPGNQRLDRRALEGLQSDPYLVTPGSDVIDGDSVLVLRGCNLGNSQQLLDAVRTLFGGELKVLAPRYYQFYEFRGDRNRELFRQGFYFWIPGNSTPNQAQTYERLRAEYAEHEISNEDLQALVADTSERHIDNQSMEFEFTYRGMAPPASQDARLEDLRAEWTPDENNQYTEVDDWSWRSQVTSHTDDATVVMFRGQRRRIEYRRLLRDANGNAVVPDLNNSGHYGRSPAW